MPDLTESLLRLIAIESAGPGPAPVMAVAEVARRRHGEAIIAVLFYGSCLRQPDDWEHSGDEGRIVDLYLLADRYAGLHRSRFARALNALLPPNVYYVEAPFEGRVVRAKYALVTLDQFERLVSRDTLEPYFWARFAQPTVILWARDDMVRDAGPGRPRSGRHDHARRDPAADVQGLDRRASYGRGRSPRPIGPSCVPRVATDQGSSITLSPHATTGSRAHSHRN